MQAWIDSFRNIVDNPTLSFPSAKIRIQLPPGSPEEIALDEDFWEGIRGDFSLSTDIINLNNGAVSSSPKVVAHAFLHYYKLVNSAPSFYIWKIMESAREVIRGGLSGLINASADEVAILRNTTEASNNVIFGIPLLKGDEVVLCRQDYAKVVSAWKQRELREGIKLCWVDLQPGIDTDEDIVTMYTSLFSDRTKIVQLTHVINWNGQVMPVEPIIGEAKKRGIEVILDGAHSFGKLETDMQKLECDYFFTALHKWLSGPIPSSLLYIRKDKIAKMWPLASSNNPQSGDIRKFEELSIQLYPNILALGFAIEYYDKIGRVTKEMRLRYLRRIWTNKLVTKDGLHFNTPLEEKRCCTIVNVAVKGWEPKELEDHLLKANFIHVGIVSQPKMKGIRITPNIYTDPKLLDFFVECMGKVEPR